MVPIISTKSHAQANESLAELKLIYNKLIEFGWFESANPVVGMKKFPGNKAKKRFVQYEELPLLLASIDQEPLQFQLIFFVDARMRLSAWRGVGSQMEGH